jgi:hypothetical protein
LKIGIITSGALIAWLKKKSSVALVAQTELSLSLG